MSERHIVGLQNVPAALHGCVLTVGNFDGVHMGHRKIIARAKQLARQAGTAAVAMTFDPAPDVVIRPNDAPQRLTTHTERVALLLEAGCDFVVTVKTDIALLSLAPADFIDQILVDRFAPSSMVEGHNFFFGAKRGGTVETLAAAGKDRGFDVVIVEPELIELDGKTQRVSSTLIRELMLTGRVEDATVALTRPFTMTGEVIGGEQVGRVLEFPTANLDPGREVVPADGVYAGRVTLEDKPYPAAISIGCKPTTGLTDRVIEANLIGASGYFYGETISVSFMHRLRGQVKFANLDELKTQITKDIQRTKEFFKHD
ncbi:MAG: bifunctional riboflavin kinase/FAD synthetase [Phycisphaerae bacterium]|nr:bifunctional riboflavin kinase/FAD synthetase [Phycisphaerae bacterium]